MLYSVLLAPHPLREQYLAACTMQHALVHRHERSTDTQGQPHIVFYLDQLLSRLPVRLPPCFCRR